MNFIKYTCVDFSKCPKNLTTWMQNSISNFKTTIGRKLNKIIAIKYKHANGEAHINVHIHEVLFHFYGGK